MLRETFWKSAPGTRALVNMELCSGLANSRACITNAGFSFALMQIEDKADFEEGPLDDGQAVPYHPIKD